MPKEYDFGEFMNRIKSMQCRRTEDGRLVCEGILDGEKAVCYIVYEGEKRKVRCLKADEVAV